MANNSKALSSARSAKKDEFYTQLTDIEAECFHYRELFRDKTVYCNCDDPFESNFFKYFVINFNFFGLKKLIATCYNGSVVAGSEVPITRNLFNYQHLDTQEANQPPVDKEGKPHIAHWIEINEVPAIPENENHGLVDIEWVIKHNPGSIYRQLLGDGSFQSQECLQLLDQADIVVTNPPFSLFRDFVAMLVKHRKQFLIVGNVNAVTYKEIFPLIASDKMWIGPSIHSGDRKFNVPDDYPLTASTCGIDQETGRKYIRVKGVRWFTNMDFKERHQELPLYKNYSPDLFPSYDNYNAIEVGKTSDIPLDYDGVMGVPITFLDKYCPTQFEILGLTGPNDTSGLRTKVYTQADTTQFQELNAARTVIVKDGHYTLQYARILIRRRQ